MTSTHEPLVSVVTPAYNAEPYLRECIESVLTQTHTHWDYTIVNNCSIDGTLDIAQQYAAKDPRIRVLNNETYVRVIENHNIAFRQISPESKYCKVVAADDWLFPECLEKMVGLAEGHPRVGIVGAYGLFGSEVLWTGLPYPSTVVPGRDACRLMLLRRVDPDLLTRPHFFGTPTSVLFRSTIVRNRYAFYNESNLHADFEACLEVLQYYDFGFVHQVLTFSRPSETGALTSRSRTLNTYLAHILADLVTYGPRYLSEAELKRRIREHLHDYYRYLGSQVYRRHDREFWKFHRDKLVTVGYPLSKARLGAYVISEIVDLVLNPKRTAERIVRRLRRKPAPS